MLVRDLRRIAGLLAILLLVAGGAFAADRLRPKESGQPAASRRAAAALLPKLNGEIATGAWVEGTGVLTVDGTNVNVKEGDAVFVEAGAEHRFTAYEQLALFVIFERTRD